MINKAARVAAFTVLVGSLYVAAIAASAKIRCGDFTLLQQLTGNYVEPGGRYQSLRRFREAESRGKVEVVFFGSSHAYRGFDPRLFEQAGHPSMNLGSMNQTPMNTYYLALRYLPQLAPELVIIELFFPTISGDGLESTRDLAANTRWSLATMRMAAATWNLGAMTFASAKGLGFVADEANAEQVPIPGESYVAGGYCETRTHRSAMAPPGVAIPIPVRRDQIDYLERTSALVRARGARVLWVTHPLPADYKRLIANGPEVDAAIARAARESAVDYWNFDASMNLDPLEDFADLHHLSATGVEKFNRELIARLTSAGYLKR